MKVINFESLAGTPREVQCPSGGFTSLRALIAGDGMGFGVHKTIIPPGRINFWHYKNHLEACCCISGRGVLECCRTGARHEIAAGDVYALDENDPNTFEAYETVVLLSIFNPPVRGGEVHGEDGSYPLEEKEHERVQESCL